MSELGIYEGCYVELRNGDVVGPLNQDLPYFRRIWKLQGQKRWWNSDGTPHGTVDEGVNIIRVMQKDSIKLTMSKTYGDFSKLGKAAIPPHVTKAAMVAGIKADPAYEEFVNAILTAAFKAQYEIEFVPVAEQAPIAVTDELLEQMASVFGDKGFYEWSDTAQQKLRGAAECAVTFFGGKQVPKNESENRIPDSEKPKGGLSDFTPFYEPGLAEKVTDTAREVLRSLLPLEGVTICFTGSMKIPVDSHKGIAESLGAKVSGSVHSNTTLVVFGIGAQSKLDKATEHDLPRMSESGWLWIAALLGYGKSEHVSPYGKFSKGGSSSTIPGITLRSYIACALDDWANNHSKMPRVEYLARVMESLISRYLNPTNESENRIPDSEKAKGGLSAIPVIPTLREIHDQVLAEVTDWRAKYGRESMPSTYAIAQAFHRMLTPTVSEETKNPFDALKTMEYKSTKE